MKRLRLMLCCALALAVGLLATDAAALYDKNGPVLQLTPRSFEKVLKSKVPVVVEFFAPWCGHCKQLAPAFSQVASTLAGIVPFVAIDCDRDTNRPLCSQYGVQGFPTIKIFTPGSKTPTDYQGERSAKALADAAVGQLTAKHVKKVTSLDEAIMFLSSPTTKVVLVTEKRRTSPMYKSLSQRYASPSSLEFAEVVKDSDSAALLAQYGVTKAPTLLAITADRETLTYNGDMKAPSIMQWLKEISAGAASSAKAAGEAINSANEATKAANEAAKAAERAFNIAEGAAGEGSAAAASEEPPAAEAAAEHAAPKQASKHEAPKQHKAHQAEDPQNQKQSEGKPAPAKRRVGVVNMTSRELARQLEKEGVVVLAFYAGSGEGACRESLKKFNDTVAGLHNMAQGVQVDVSTPKEAAAVKAQYGIELTNADNDGSCDLKIFVLPFGPEDHADIDEWKAFGGEVSTNELYKASVEMFPNVAITPITSETFSQRVAADINRVLTRAMVILFTDKAEPPPLYRALSVNFRHLRLDFGLVHSSDAKLVKQFEVKKVPTLLASFPLGPPKRDGAVQMNASSYSGPTRYSDMATWLLRLALELGATPEELLDRFGVGNARKDAHVPQITDQATWRDSCLDKSGVCIVAALSRDAAERQKQLAVMRAVAKGRAEQPFHFCWFEEVEVGAGQQFAEQLGLYADEAPALVALALKKKRSIGMTGSFAKDTISNWLDDLLSGKIRTIVMPHLPVFPDTRDPLIDEGAADAGVGVSVDEAPMEDEFDLSDIMDEEIEGAIFKAAKKDEL